MAREHDTLRIADLYPYEASGASGKVAKHLRTIESQKSLDPVEVLKIEGEYLVVDGTNRVIAAKQSDWSEVPVKFVVRQPQELGPYREALDEARRNKRKGFENMLIGGVGERADGYRGSMPSAIDELVLEQA